MTEPIDAVGPHLTVVTGPMFAEKTRTLLWYARRAKRMGVPVQVYVPAVDTRHGEGVMRSHDGEDLTQYGAKAWAVSHKDVDSLASRLRTPQTRVIIDEVQFMPAAIVQQVRRMLKAKHHVVVAGLSLDYEQHPFENTLQLLGLADTIVKLTAVCAGCNKDCATITRRKTANGPRVQLGGSDLYEPLCRACWGSSEE